MHTVKTSLCCENNSYYLFRQEIRAISTYGDGAGDAHRGDEARGGAAGQRGPRVHRGRPGLALRHAGRATELRHQDGRYENNVINNKGPIIYYIGTAIIL